MAILSHDSQVVGPPPTLAANQFSIDDLAIELRFGDFVDILERPDNPHFAQAEDRIGIVYRGLRRRPVVRRWGIASAAVAFSLSVATGIAAVAAAIAVPVAVVAPAVSAAIPATVTTTISAAVTPAV